MSLFGGTKVDELHQMSDKEISRYEVMQRIKRKELRQKEAARMLGLSTRQIKRLYRAYKQQGAAGLISEHRNKPSNNRLEPKVVQETVDLLHQRYHDFGPTLAHEKLVEVHRLKISVESVRRLMIEEGLWKARKAKKPLVHQMRERRSCRGELIQIDGSDHDWFEGRGPRCTLLVYIDDATGELDELCFVPAETTFGYFEATRHYLERHGKPVAFYSDKHSVFRVNQEQTSAPGSGMTQFGRAMKDLNIQIICANSPQAKGRVERANQTLQDRLVKELRLQGISDIESANAFLPQFREDFNRRFAVQPRSSHDAHRSLSNGDDLDLIFTIQNTRTLSKNLTLQYNKTIYQIRTNRPDYALRNAHVTICENASGHISILYKGKPLPFSIFHMAVRQAEVVDTKNLDHYLRPHVSPAPDHPWRQYGRKLNGNPVQEALPLGND